MIYQEIGNSTWVPSFSSLENLSYLEILELEGTHIRDAALSPLSSFRRLSFLSLGSSYLTDASLPLLTHVQKLVHLGIHNAVLTNAGLDCFSPPPALKLLDLMGCWLLTEDGIRSFHKKHPNLEVRHDLVNLMPSNKDRSVSLSPSKTTSKISLAKQQRNMPISPPRVNNSPFVGKLSSLFFVLFLFSCVNYIEMSLEVSS